MTYTESDMEKMREACAQIAGSPQHIEHPFVAGSITTVPGSVLHAAHIRALPIPPPQG